MAPVKPLRIASQDHTGTRIGRIIATGYVDDGPQMLPRPRRILDSYALVVVHGGTGTFSDDMGGTRQIGPGDAILVLPGHSHWYGPHTGGRWSEIWLMFDGSIFDALRAGGVLSAEQPVRHLQPIEAWRTRLGEFVERRRPVGAVDRELEIIELGRTLVELGHTATTEPLPGPIEVAREMLAADLAAHLDLHGIALRVGMPYETFRKRFRAATGTSPAAFRLQRRIEAAKMLLRTTTMTHASIAEHVGFADEYHFAKRFRERVGTSPRTYRGGGIPANLQQVPRADNRGPH